MSEGLKEAATDAVEAAKQSLINRFSGAFTAYVVTTWLAINWSDIAILFMSTVSVEQRIQAIYGQHAFWLYSVILPVIIGFLLSIIIPGINAIVVSFTSYFLARSETSQRRARIRVEIEIEKQNSKKLAITARLDQLRTERNYITTEIDSLQSKKDELIESITICHRDILTISLRCQKLINEMDSLFRKEELSLENIKEIVNNLFTPNERRNAEGWRQEVRDTFGLDAAQALLEGRPGILTVDNELVKELLLSSKNEALKDRSSTANPQNT